MARFPTFRSIRDDSARVLMRSPARRFNPSRLELARQRRGLSRTALAARLAVSLRTLQRWERSESEPDEEQCAELATALGVMASFFYGDDLDPLPESSVSFRALSKLPSGERHSALASGRLGVELMAWVEQRFKLPQTAVSTLPEWEPETAAECVRSRWGMGSRSIPALLPLLELHGVRVLSLPPSARSVDAFSFYWQGTPFVFLDTSKTGERIRFDAAHELGHLVLHCEHGAPQGREAEHQAHRFASAFLMPKESVFAADLFNASLQHVLRARRRWGVAAMALTHRLHDLNLVSDWRYRELCIQLSARGYRTSEPGGIAQERSQVLDKVLHALRERGVGTEDIASELGWQADDLRAHVFGLTLTGHPGHSESSGTRHDAKLSLINGSDG